MVMCVITGTIVFLINVHQQQKIAVVDAIKLFDGYDMKKELEESAKVKLEAESKQLDSIGNALKMAHSLNNGEDKIKELTYDYNFMKTKLDNDYTQSNRDINEQIWKRLNPLLDEYGKKKKLHLIIGANGMGSVLYNDEYYERTNDVISYINKKYYEGN